MRVTDGPVIDNTKSALRHARHSVATTDELSDGPTQVRLRESRGRGGPDVTGQPIERLTLDQAPGK